MFFLSTVAFFSFCMQDYSEQFQLDKVSMNSHVHYNPLHYYRNKNLIVEPSMKSMNIDVDSNNGVVTLTGIASSIELKSRALEIAQKTSGVVQVIDNLKVKTPEEFLEN